MSLLYESIFFMRNKLLSHRNAICFLKEGTCCPTCPFCKKAFAPVGANCFLIEGQPAFHKNGHVVPHVPSIRKHLLHDTAFLQKRHVVQHVPSIRKHLLLE